MSASGFRGAAALAALAGAMNSGADYRAMQRALPRNLGQPHHLTNHTPASLRRLREARPKWRSAMKPEHEKSDADWDEEAEARADESYERDEVDPEEQ